MFFTEKHRNLLHQIRLIHEKRSVVVNVQVMARTDENGELKYNNYHCIEEEVQELMTK